MKKWIVLSLIFLLSGFVNANAQEAEQEVKMYFKNGLKMRTDDGAFKFQIGGRLMVDFASYYGNDKFDSTFGDPQGGAEVRRGRLFASGLLYDTVTYKLQLDFTGAVTFKDAYIGLIKVPLFGNFQVGHTKSPFSLEDMTSSKYITFMERSLMNAFAPGRDLGVKFFNHALDKRMTWAVGLYTLSSDTPPKSLEEDSTVFSTRVTGLPWYQDKGKKLVHIGFGYGFIDPGGIVANFESRPESHITPIKTVSTGDFKLNNYHRVNLESALVYDSFSLQGEYTLVAVHQIGGVRGNTVNGFYIQGSYFITGEHRNYKTKSGAFDRVSPLKNFDGKGNLGAWEVAARFSRIDLNDGSLAGGEQSDVTLGVNWYLNPQTRIMLNYVNASIDDDAGSDAGNLHVIQTRFQVDF